MSWMKRRSHATANPGAPPPRMYNPNQLTTHPQPYQQEQWQQPLVQHDQNNWYGTSQSMEINAVRTQTVGNTDTQNYWPQSYAEPNSNQQIHIQYNQYAQYQNYYPTQGHFKTENLQQGYNPPSQLYVQHTSDLHQQVNQPQSGSKDPWNWGWEDNNLTEGDIASNNQTVQDSFTHDESWNWTVDDASLNQNIQHNKLMENNYKVENKLEDISNVNRTSNICDVENKIKCIEDNPEQLPGKHVSIISTLKNETLTPQWSIESQDSSDDVILTSESDNRSNILSRSSTISHSPSRPSSTHENVAEFMLHYSKCSDNVSTVATHNEYISTIKQNVTDEIIQSEVKSDLRGDCDNLNKGMQGLSINIQTENKEIVSPENMFPIIDKESLLEQSTQLDRNNSEVLLRGSVKEEIKSPVVQISGGKMSVPVINSSEQNKLPTNNNSLRFSDELLSNVENNETSIHRNYLSNELLLGQDNMSVNLETLPENSEQPDQPVEHMQKDSKNINVQKQWIADNCEVAPINDRNQYLETGQLSDIDIPYGMSDVGTSNNPHCTTDTSDSLPPPGLSRLVLGQLEHKEIIQSNDNIDEPPPGLSRMVLGRTETESHLANQSSTTEFRNNNIEEPPAGLRRMIPGESSSPESSSYTRYQTESNLYQPSHYDDDNYVSEMELNQVGALTISHRSATIGADTPPVVSQQSTASGAYLTSSLVDLAASRVGAVGIDNEQRDTDVDGANTLDESKPSANSSPPDNNRRDNIDGGPHDDIRNPITRQNSSEVLSSSVSQQEKVRKSNRNYATDSDHEREDRHRNTSPGRYEKDSRYYDEKRKNRDSPEQYRERKYDRKYDRRSDRRGDRRDERRERYDDDTDYNSDKEPTDRSRKDVDEYDRRFSRYKNDKDREREKRRRDYGRNDRDRRNEYYYRYDDDYYKKEVNRSRPSSRSDSAHDSYRAHSYRHDRETDRGLRHRERDRDKDHRRQRDTYNQYFQPYNFDSYNPYYQQYQQYQYYENLRRTNPQAYAEWYRKYYQSQGTVLEYNTDDRASVHSGRSSANGDLSRDRLMDHTDSSLILDDTTTNPQRLTPAKFTTAHIKASLSSGHLIKILPNYPLDGQPAMVKIINIKNYFQDNEEAIELTEFPGPLVKGVTHKKTVIEYCENKIRKANSCMPDFDSYILMWELLILLLKQNGMVVGTDIAELLMKNNTLENSHSQATFSSNNMKTEIYDRDQQDINQYSDKHLTDKFREYLIYGSGKEALEWAMKHGLWGHALFLASKLDKRTYANVMMRFANGLTLNDPLQTLYQLLSGKQPAAVTCVADEKWGDWRPHLAMILSNTTQHPELYRKAITSLGDTLFNRGSLYAAQFCYLMAQVEFSRYGVPDAKLVLLGSSHHQPMSAFAKNEAIFMTEIYEYACSLSDASYSIPEFLVFKYFLVTRMVDHGLLEKGLQYLEHTTKGIIQYPTRVDSRLVSLVYNLADKLKYCDPLLTDDLDPLRSEATWLYNLKLLFDECNNGMISPHTVDNLSPSEIRKASDFQTETPEYQNVVQQWQTEPSSMNNYLTSNEQHENYNQFVTTQHNLDLIQSNIQQEQDYWNQQHSSWEESQNTNLTSMEQHQGTYWDNSQHQDISQPQITLSNQSKKTYFDEEGTTAEKKITTSKAKPKLPAKPASTGWFGGIWNKLSLKPKNQMILPDDKNPTIVWDSEKKRWVNLEADVDESSNEVKPPPKMSEMIQTNTGVTNTQDNLDNFNTSRPPLSDPNAMKTYNIGANGDTNAGPPSLGQSNMFKLRRSRNIKNSYIDVFNPGGIKPTNENVPPGAEVFGAIPLMNKQVNYFVPAPLTDTNAPVDFLTPTATKTTAVTTTEDTSRVQDGLQMYNPNQFNVAGRGQNN